MSRSINTLDDVRRDVRSMHLFDNEVTAGSYNPLFYNHLLLLIKPKLLSPHNDVDQMTLNFRSYVGLEQFTMDNSGIVETEPARDIDWNFVDEGKNIFESFVVAKLRAEGRSEYFKPLVKFSADQFENFLIYDQQYPQSVYNPWSPVHEMFSSGFMVLFSDNRDVLDAYNKKIYKSSENTSKLGIVAKAGKSNRVGGFMADRRHSIFSIVFEYLRNEAPGSQWAKSIHMIKNFLEEQGRRYEYAHIKNSILLPLKRAGLVGSGSNGFYYLTNKEDFLSTYHSHLEKIRGIRKTLTMYEDRYRSMEYGDLKQDHKDEYE